MPREFATTSGEIPCPSKTNARDSVEVSISDMVSRNVVAMCGESGNMI